MKDQTKKLVCVKHILYIVWFSGAQNMFFDLIFQIIRVFFSQFFIEYKFALILYLTEFKVQSGYTVTKYSFDISRMMDK